MAFTVIMIEELGEVGRAQSKTRMERCKKSQLVTHQTQWSGFTESEMKQEHWVVDEPWDGWE